MTGRGADLLTLWEAGDGRPLLHKGLVLLSVASPSVAAEGLAEVSLGRRNRAILELRRRLWGAAIVAEATCPACGERLEMDLDLRSMTSLDSETDRRLVTTADLLAVAGLPRQQARAALLERLGIDGDASEELAGADPLAEIAIEPTCPACEHRWLVYLDPVKYVWDEIEARAMRLLRDVHKLARAYGWSEAEILAMPGRRRRLYLRMVEVA